jgi:hypothetical protein
MSLPLTALGTAELIAAFANRSDFTAAVQPQALLSSATRIRAAGLSLNMICQQVPDQELHHISQARPAQLATAVSPYVAPSPHAGLDGILSHARHLIFDFDGPLCDMTAAMPADTADQLRATLRAAITHLPPEVTATGDRVTSWPAPRRSARTWPPGSTPSSPPSRQPPH